MLRDVLESSNVFLNQVDEKIARLEIEDALELLGCFHNELLSAKQDLSETPDDDPVIAYYWLQVAYAEYFYMLIDLIIMGLQFLPKPNIPVQERIDTVSKCFFEAIKILSKNGTTQEILKTQKDQYQMLAIMNVFKSKIDLGMKND